MPQTLNSHYLRKAYQDLSQFNQNALINLLARSYQHMDEVYHERAFLLCALAALALELGYLAGMAPLPPQLIQADNWRFLLIIDLPSGKVSFPISDEELPIFGSLPSYRGNWDGYRNRQEQQHILRYPGCRELPTDPMPVVP